MPKIDPIYVGRDAIGQFLAYIDAHQLRRFILVADTNTYRALGERVAAALQEHGCELSTIVLDGENIHADEHQLTRVFVQAPLGDYTFLAVGSGTITDITRFVSHRSGRSFIGLPTAPSVDGFTSMGAPIILGGVKITLNCQAPLAVFADLETLCQAPQRLLAAGFGDMIGKYSSLADWALGTLVWEEPYDAGIARRTRAAIDSVEQNVDAIGQKDEAGVRALMEALIESGLCMLDLGNSRPASGAEHHASHYWEMQRLKDHRETALHGAQVGVGLTLSAAQWTTVRELSRAEVMNRLEAAALPDRESEMAHIREGYGDMAEDIARDHLAFLDLTEAGFDQVKRRIADGWEQIQAIAAQVPAPETVRASLQKVGGPATWAELKLEAEEVQPGMEYGHYLRDRFTIMKLSRILGVPLGAPAE
ncbi:MAG: sn-glycerol-1-phosphate dehydrogenase [Chloroflexi bacterium]|nr:sn-glycerol-1-phosphate dehydrogenase [Chloroflexota bacterium]